jgi:uncharacterized protein YfcZ (UPF0381/DUF406 family)
MIEKEIKDKIIEIWKKYVESNQENVDLKGNVIPVIDFDQKRLDAILDIKEIINAFLKGENNIFVFKTAIDSYNKKNNLWGFTAIKGQMFFNQLANSNENSIEELTSLLKRVISEPNDLKAAIQKISELEKHVRKSFDLATDKRKVPNPKSCNYFLSYFWQIQNPEKWAIMYSSLIESLVELNIWEDKENQAESYKHFFNLNEEIKDVLSTLCSLIIFAQRRNLISSKIKQIQKEKKGLILMQECLLFYMFGQPMLGKRSAMNSAFVQILMMNQQTFYFRLK